MVYLILIFFLVSYFLVILYFNYKYPELYWNWDNISTDDITFPKSFMWGTATASHQVEGNCINNWSKFEKGIKDDGSPNINNSQSSGMACDHWNQYPDDIKLIKKLGVSYYRFSIEWSKIQPEKDVFNSEVLEHYSKKIDMLLENKITPVVTLLHFTYPIWFEKLGAFEKEKNISLFISFCEKVFDEFSDRVEYWCTINEPAVVATQGYFTGLFPPGLKDPQLSGIVLRNLLDAHVQVYHKLKNNKNGSKSKIGLVKNINQFEPWRRWNIFDWIISYFVNQLFNNSTIDFLKSGNYNVQIPGLVWINYKNDDAINSIDFFGLNYYSHNHLKMKFSLKEPFILKYRKSDIMTDMPYVIYGEGIYRAIQHVSVLGCPIIITENGIADSKDNRREIYIKHYLYAVNKAIKDGYDIQGYFYWSLMDNFEWAFGYDMKFGLYSVNFKTQKRKLRPSAKAFIHIVNKNNYE